MLPEKELVACFAPTEEERKLLEEREKIAKLIEWLLSFLWGINFKVSQEIFIAVWWLKSLEGSLAAQYKKQEEIDFKRRTCRRQLAIVADFFAHFMEAIKSAELENLATFLSPEPPKPMRINELPLYTDQTQPGWPRDVFSADIVFWGTSDRNSWSGVSQDSPRKSVRCKGKVIYRNVVGMPGDSSVLTLEPIGVLISDRQNEHSLEQNSGVLISLIRARWNDPDLFEPHDFVRVMDLKSPAYGMMTTIQRKSLEPKKKQI